VTPVLAAPNPSPIPSSTTGFGVRPPLPRRPRNLVGAALGLLLVLFCATAVAIFASNAGHRHPVLVVVRTVRSGSPITARDIGEARVAADPLVHAMAGSERDRVVGRVAAVELVSGTLLTRAELSSGPVVAAGFSVVGLNVKLGYAPAGLRPADRVRLVLASSGANAAADGSQPGAGGQPISGVGTVLTSEAQVFDVTATPDGQGEIVSVIVDDRGAPLLAADGARGEVSVVLLGGGR
jgi:SAF domain